MPEHSKLPEPNDRTFAQHAHAESLDPPRIEADELFENDPTRDRDLPKRRLARERVLQVLYAYAMGAGDLDRLFVELAEPDLAQADERTGRTGGDSAGALDFARGLTREWHQHHDEINRVIGEKLERWDLQRVALIDNLLMQIGVVELLYFPDIPPKATINELIEIAKDFSTEESGKFINGLLHALMTQFQHSGKIQKSGRGLLEESVNGYRPAKGRKT